MNRPGRHFRFSPWPILLVLVAIGMAVGVFTVTQRVQQREARVAELNHKLLTEQQTMRVLDAEWAYLTRPQRLEELIAMKVAQGDMPPVPTPIATIAPETNAKIEPASGVSESKIEESKKETVKPAVEVTEKKESKPAALKKVAIKKEIKKEPVKKIASATKPKTKTAKMKDDVWPIARKNASVARPSQKIAGTPRAGVARPIVE